jgi:hypothetical protein
MTGDTERPKTLAFRPTVPAEVVIAAVAPLFTVGVVVLHGNIMATLIPCPT